MMTNLQLERHLTTRLPGHDTRRLVLLTGARQVGKTTLARRTYPGLRYVSLDAVEDRAALREVPSGQWPRIVGPAILDEAQKEPALFEKLKLAFDSGGVNFSVLLGSAHVLMLERVRETLAGRVFVYELWPLTLAELAARGDAPKAPLLARIVTAGAAAAEVLAEQPRTLLGADEGSAIEAAEHLAAWGGMPALLPLGDGDRRDWLRSYHDTYLQRDLADLARLRDLQPFMTFQRLAAGRTANLLSFAELGRDAGVSASTARSYLEYLRISYQAILLQPYSANLTSSVVKAPKLYWTDVGIARHLTRFWGPVSGSLFETMVVAEVVKLVRTLGLDVEPAFYRTRSGMEVDLVLASSRGVLALETKARATASATDFRPMRAIAEALGERFLGGIVVTMGGVLEQIGRDPRFWSVPFHRLLA